MTVLTPADAREGFRLAGASQQVVAPEQLEVVVKGYLQGEQTGLLVVDERLLSLVSAERLAELASRWSGLLIILPAPGPTPPEADEFQRLVRRALGYHIRLQS